MTDEEITAILRFLRAASTRVQEHPGRVPLDARSANMTINWLRGIVGALQDDGSLEIQ